MISTGYGQDDDKSSCSICNEYIEQVELVADSVDAIEKRLNELKVYFATHEWVLVSNAMEMKKLHNPSDVDADSLQMSYAQSVRFKRLLDSTARSLDRIRSSCNQFGGLEET